MKFPRSNAGPAQKGQAPTPTIFFKGPPKKKFFIFNFPKKEKEGER